MCAQHRLADKHPKQVHCVMKLARVGISEPYIGMASLADENNWPVKSSFVVGQCGVSYLTGFRLPFPTARRIMWLAWSPNRSPRWNIWVNLNRRTYDKTWTNGYLGRTVKHPWSNSVKQGEFEQAQPTTQWQKELWQNCLWCEAENGHPGGSCRLPTLLFLKMSSKC